MWCCLYLASCVFLFTLIGRDPWTGDTPILKNVLNVLYVSCVKKEQGVVDYTLIPWIKAVGKAVLGSRSTGLQKIRILISLIVIPVHQTITNFPTRAEKIRFIVLVNETLPKLSNKILLITFNYFKTQ